MGTRPQRLALVWPLKEQLTALMTHERGHFFVLTALQYLDSQDAAVLLTYLAGKVDDLISGDTGYGIKSLLSIIEYFPVSHLGFVLDEVVGKAVEFACKKRGYQIIEKLLMKGAESVDHTWFLCHELLLDHDRIVTLCCDAFGCRTLAALLRMGSDEQKYHMVERLMRYVAPIACSPHGSYVAEAVVHAAQPNQQFDLTFAIIRARPEFGYSHSLVMMADVPCANFVIERMLATYVGDALYHLRVVLNSLKDRINASEVGYILWERLTRKYTMPPTTEVPYVPPPPNPADMGEDELPFVPPNIFPVRARGGVLPVLVEPDFPSVAYQDVRVFMRRNLAYVEDPLVQWFNVLAIRADSSDYRLEHFKGHFLALALDKVGGQFLQGRLEPSGPGIPTLYAAEGNEISDVINEILPYFYTCCKNLYATRVVQQLFKLGPNGLRDTMFENVMRQLRTLIRTENACYVVCAAMRHCSEDRAWHIVDHLVTNIRSGLKHKHQVAVLRTAVELYGLGNLYFIADAIMENITEYTCHKVAGIFLQFILELETDEHETLAFKQVIMTEVTANAVELIPTIRDRVGNYLIQKILTRGDAQMRTTILQAVRNESFEVLSDEQTSRGVIQRLFETITEEEQLAVLQDMANAPEVGEPFMLGDVPLAHCPIVRMASGVFSQHVVATMCEHSRGAARDLLVAMIEQHYDDIQRTLSAEFVAEWFANLN